MQDDYEGRNRRRFGLHKFYCSPDIIITIKFCDIKDGGHV
jgi:hypothetical protein